MSDQQFVEVRDPTTRPHRHRWIIPPVFWAAFGVLCLAAQAWVFSRWISDGGLHAVPADGYEIPSVHKVVIWLAQAVIVGGLAWFALRFVRDCRREHRVTFLAAVFVGYFSIVWTTPLSNYSEFVVASNRYSINVTSWGPYFPGWHGPYPSQAVSVLLDDGAYVLLIFWVWLVLAATNRISRRRPGWGLFRLAVVATLAGFVVDIVLQTVAIRFGTYAYARALPGFTMFEGHWYQLPLSSTLMVTLGIVLPVVLSILHVRGTDREVWVLQGSDRLPTPLQHGIRLLAGVGFANLCLLLTHAGFIAFTLLGNAPIPADFPSYLRPPGS